MRENPYSSCFWWFVVICNRQNKGWNVTSHINTEYTCSLMYNFIHIIWKSCLSWARENVSKLRGNLRDGKFCELMLYFFYFQHQSSWNVLTGWKLQFYLSSIYRKIKSWSDQSISKKGNLFLSIKYIHHFVKICNLLYKFHVEVKILWIIQKVKKDEFFIQNHVECRSRNYFYE